MRGYTQDWVDSAPTATIREERAQDRAKANKEVAEMKRKSKEYALAFLAGAVVLSIASYGLGKRRRVEQLDPQPRRGD
jgi:hypothetical protein